MPSSLSNLAFEELGVSGIPVTGVHIKMYESVRAHWPDRPIVFDLTFSQPHSDGGARVYRDAIKVWIKRGIPHPGATLAHELAHLINDAENEPPRLHPERPSGPARQILSDLISMSEHQIVHNILKGYGSLTGEEARDRSQNFLRDIRTAPLDREGRNLHLSIGYGMMLTVYRDEDLSANVSAAMRKKSIAAATLGERLANYLLSVRNTSLHEDAVQLMTIADVQPQFSACVYSQDKFRETFGWL